MPFVKKEYLESLEHAFQGLARLCVENNTPGLYNFAIPVQKNNEATDLFIPRKTTSHSLKEASRKPKKSNTIQLTIDEHTNYKG